MEYNPHSQEYSRIQTILGEIKNKKRILTDDLTWFDNADIGEIYLSLDRAKQDKENLLRLIGEGEGEFDVLQRKAKEVKSLIGTAFNPLNWFDSEQKELKVRLNVVSKELHSKESQIDRARNSLSKIQSSISDTVEKLEKYKSFNRQQTSNNLNVATYKIAELENEFSQVSKLKNKVEIELRPIINQISGYESNIATAKDHIRRAEPMNQRLDEAENSYERAIIHQECEKLFGDGSPSKVIRKQEVLIRQYEKDLDKARRRALEVGKKAARDIRKIVIDGNNLCYEGGNFVGLEPLIALTRGLHQQYEVIVVFDSAIRSQVKSNDNVIRAQFEVGVKVHVVASKQLADDTILSVASNNKFCYVISNDRYGEYREKEAVVDSRIIRHEILDRRVMIHDLNFNERYG